MSLAAEAEQLQNDERDYEWVNDDAANLFIKGRAQITVHALRIKHQ